jgi:DeoR/GlpR family transcriptional regulator of sugar metabolism
MLKEERQQYILEKLSTDKKVTLIALSQLLNVSYDSIRRDVIELEEQGLLKKVHGGAIAKSYLSMKARQEMGIQNPEIVTLAKKAAKLFENGQIILMDGGSTNLYIAEQLPRNIEVTIITNNPPLALILSDFPKVDVILLGGKLHKRYQITAGPEIAEQIKYLKADLYLMGVVGADPWEGMMLRDYEEANQKRKMLNSARKVVVCASQEKLATSAPHRICGVEDINILVTSLKTNDPILNHWQGKIELI